MPNHGSRAYQIAWRIHERLLGAIIKQERRGKAASRRMADIKAGLPTRADQPEQLLPRREAVAASPRSRVPALRECAVQPAQSGSNSSPDGAGNRMGIPGAS